MEKTLGDDRELRQENEAKEDHQTEVCLHSDFHIVCVCVCSTVHVNPWECVCVCVLNLQYHRVCEPLTVSKKGGCNLHFCALVQEQQQIKKSHA